MKQRRILTALLVFLVALLQSAWGKESKELYACVLLSSDLKPYMEVLDGFRETFKGRVKALILGRSQEDKKHTAKILKESKCSVILAVGFRAVNFTKKLKKKKVFSLLLYHFLYKETLKSFKCGIYLEIPPESIVELCLKLKKKPRVGTFFSEPALKSYIADLEAAFKQKGGDFRAVFTSSKVSFSSLLKNLLSGIDILLLIPDPILSSEEIAEWVVLSAVAQRKLVVGYNRFFIDAGAAAAFVIDYRETGRETAKLVEQLLDNGTCESAPAAYREIVNYKVLKKLK